MSGVPIVRIERQCLLVAQNCVRWTTSLDQRKAEICPSFGVIGFELYGLVEDL